MIHILQNTCNTIPKLIVSRIKMLARRTIVCSSSSDFGQTYYKLSYHDRAVDLLLDKQTCSVWTSINVDY